MKMSWPVPSSSVPPTSITASLVYPNEKQNLSQTFCTLPDGNQHVQSIPEICETTKCFGNSYGWLIFGTSHSIILFNPITLAKIHLPPCPGDTAIASALTSSPTDPNCVAVFISDEKWSLFFCKVGGEGWSEQNLVREQGEAEIRIQAVISGNEKIYLFFRVHMAVGDVISTFFHLGMAVVDDINDTYASVKRCHIHDPQLSLDASCVGCSKDYVESCGEIFMVVFLFFGGSRYRIQTLDVFKLDFGTISWVMVETLGDQIFLLGNNCTSVSATELGLKSNCIYFYHQELNTILYRYNMDDGTISNFLACSRTDPNSADPFWLVSNCKQEGKNQVTELFQESYCLDEVNQGMGLKYIPNELIDLIFTNLFLGDSVRFRLACKSWISMCPLLRSHPLLLPSHPESRHLPWLISFPKNNRGVCKFYNPIFGDAYTVNLPQLAGATLRCAKYGWLLMSRGKVCFFFFNPFSKEIIQLPNLEDEHGLGSISFSAPPTSSDFIVFGEVPFGMYIYRKGQETWSEYDISTPDEFVATNCTAAVCDGVFYLLGRGGNLGVFNPMAIDEESRWKILDVSPVFSFSVDDDIGFARSMYVVNDNLDIISVFVSHQGDKIWVYRYDRLNNKWSEVQSLGDKVLFLSHTTSMLVPAGLKGVGNRIYFPRFYVKDNVSKGNVFYSLSSKRFHCFGSECSPGNWTDTSEHWHCAWFQSSQ